MGTFSPSYRAAGTIEPSRFVRADDTVGANDFANTDMDVVAAADGTYPLLGVSQEGARNPGGVIAGLGGADITAAALDNDPIHVYGPGEECLLRVLANTEVWFGYYMTATTAGDGNPVLEPWAAASGGDTEGSVHVGGIARQGVVAAAGVSPLIRLQVILGQIYLPATP